MIKALICAATVALCTNAYAAQAKWERLGPPSTNIEDRRSDFTLIETYTYKEENGKKARVEIYHSPRGLFFGCVIYSGGTKCKDITAMFVPTS